MDFQETLKAPPGVCSHARLSGLVECGGAVPPPTRHVDGIVGAMDVTVKFFATYRELTGLTEARVALRTGATLEDLLNRLVAKYPGLGGHRKTMLLAVNQEFADSDARLSPGDEVALLPPVSGGVGPYCRLQTGPIEPEDVINLVRDARAGAIVLFVGTVRADPGVAALDYEAYEGMAVKKMEALRTAAKAKFGVTGMAIVHRTGRLPLGETSVAVACSAPHRQGAFQACAWAMEELKAIVPIWKTEREA